MSSLPSPPIDLLDGASLFLDFDGTLVDLIDRPDKVVVDDGLQDLLGRICAVLPGRVAIVSGRSVEQIDQFLGESARSMAVAGSHGIERRSSNGAMTLPDSPDFSQAIAAMRDFVARHPGTIIEQKRYGVALHYRLAPDVEHKARLVVQDLAETLGFDVQAGKMMIDLKIAGGNKGQAVSAFLQEPSMRGTRPWFIGDDLTDEAGFATANALGGGGIVVGDLGETSAHYRLGDVAAVRAWLAEAIRTLA